MIKIISDGTAAGTRVYAGDTEITGISKIEIKPIMPGGLVECSLHFERVELDSVAGLDLDSGL